MSLRIFGDSHCGSLKWALDQMKAKGSLLDVSISFVNGWYLQYPFFERRHDRIEWLQPDFKERFAELGGSSDLFRETEVCYAMSMGLHTLEIARHPMWRDHSPWRVAISTENAVSDSTVYAMALRYSAPVLHLYDAMCLMSISFFVVAAPPPLRDHPSIAEGTRIEVLKEVDRLFREAVSTRLASSGISVVSPPESAQDQAGFLLPQYRLAAEDPHHANGLYGELMLKKILDHARISWPN